jgi:hypothetical protein
MLQSYRDLHLDAMRTTLDINDALRQGIPPFPEAEGMHFAAALSSHARGILCGRHTVTDRPRGLVGVGGSKPDFDVGPGDAISAY